MLDLTLREDETLLGAYRQTKALLVKPFLIFFVLAGVPAYLFFKYGLLGEYWQGITIWSLLFLGFLVYKLLLWNLQLLVVTNKRVIKISYPSLFKKEVAESPWPQVANIGFKRTGFWAALFNFGDLQIYIGQMPNPIIVEQIPKAGELKDILWKVQSASQTTK